VTYDRAERYYIDYLSRCSPSTRGMTIAIDCAHGATFRVRPGCSRASRATSCASAAGHRHQHQCRVGRAAPAGAPAEAPRVGAQVGFAFDGDGDRLVSVDDQGEIRDGDYALAIAARHLQSRGDSRATSWSRRSWPSRTGRVLRAGGIDIVKTQVGDRYVYEEMQPARHVGGGAIRPPALLDHSPARRRHPVRPGPARGPCARPARRCPSSPGACGSFPRCRQRARADEAAHRDVAGFVGPRAGVRERDERRGRILIRYSGTESLARVMIEGADGDRIRTMADDLAAIIRQLNRQRHEPAGRPERARRPPPGRGESGVSRIGVDLVHLRGCVRFIERWQERFLRRVSRTARSAYCQGRATPPATSRRASPPGGWPQGARHRAAAGIKLARARGAPRSPARRPCSSSTDASRTIGRAGAGAIVSCSRSRTTATTAGPGMLVAPDATAPPRSVRRAR